MNSIWDIEFLQNSVRDWATAIAITAAIIIAAKIIQKVVLIRIKNFVKNTTTTFDDFLLRLIQRTVMPMLYVMGVYAGSAYLTKQGIVEKILHAAFLTTVVFFVIRAIGDLLSYAFQRMADNTTGQAKQARGILVILKVILWLGAVVFLLDNLGYNITAIVAGLGIGGIAIALAAQTILADLFSYLVIFFDKPFEVGDFIMLGDKSGIVDYIGIKTTRLRTLAGEQLIVSNTDLTNSRVQNFKRMEKRRVIINIGVTYDTGAKKLKMIPGIIKETIEAEKAVSFDRAHFAGFGDFSLNFEIVYYVLSADYLEHMETQQQFLLQIYERFEQEEIEFAYPTQKLFLQQNNSNSVREHRVQVQ